VLEHKSGNISETRKDRGKVTNALSNGTIPDPYGLPFPRLGVCNPTPKLQSLLSQEQLKLGTSNLAGIFRGSIRTQAHEKCWRKGSVGVSRDFPNFFEYPLLYQERVKLRTSNLVGIFTGSIRAKAL